MTAQIGIFNKKGIALATDSAVTISRGNKQKAFNTADKLFELIPGAPIGIMTFSNAEFMGIPYEVLIKQYKTYEKCKFFDTLEEYRDNFMSFISTNIFLSRKAEEASIALCVLWHLHRMMDVAIEKLGDRDISDEEAYRAILNEISEYEKYIEKEGKHKAFEDIDEESFFQDYDHIFREVVETELGIFNDNGDSAGIDRMISLMKKSLVSNVVSGNNSGIIIAGYGKKDIFPKEYTFEVEFAIQGRLKFKEENRVVIDDDNTATIRTYAQGEMAQAFIRGINPNILRQITGMSQDLLGNIGESFNRIKEHYMKANSLEADQIVMNEHADRVLTELGEALRDTFIENIHTMERDMYIPLINTVESLNKQEIAELAENLVNVTSLKRKISMETDSVGGPIDVAVITKNEGFIWIKRKYFFDRELNPFYNDKKRREFNEFVEKCR